MVYDYSNITYHLGGMSTISDLRGSGQEGILLHLRDCNDKPFTMFLPKRDCAHLAKTTKEGRKFWKRFRLPKMKKQ